MKTYSKQDVLRIFTGLPISRMQWPEPTDVGRLVDDSRKVEKRDLFLALERGEPRLKIWIQEAVERGAQAIITDRHQWVPPTANYIQVKAVQGIIGRLAARFYGNPQQDLTAIGVIGSEHRAFVAALLHYLVDSVDYPVGLLAGSGNDLVGERLPAKWHTPKPLELFEQLKKIVDSGGREVVMEVSTQGLVDGRVDEMGFHVLIFTGHNPDPLLDAMEREFLLKCKIDAFVSPPCSYPPDYAVINRDSVHARELILRIPRSVEVITYGSDQYAMIRYGKPIRSGRGWRFPLWCRLGHPVWVYSPSSRDGVLSSITAAIAGGIVMGHDPQVLASQIPDFRTDDGNALTGDSDQLRLKLC